MKKATWIKKIKEQMSDMGIYDDSFKMVVETCAEVLEERDHIREEYIADGARPTVIKTSDRGATNVAKNPLLQLWNEQNKLALQFWRELGMTPSALKKLNEESMKESGGDPLAEALASLGAPSG